MHRELVRRGFSCGRHQVARIMRKFAIAGRNHRKRRQFTASKAPAASANVLNRHFDQSAPNKAWVVDFKYISTSSGWLFLAVVLDLFSRRIVGRSLSSNADEAFVQHALQQAIETRNPSPGLIHHSDQGSVYTAVKYGEMMAKHQLIPSMSRRGNCHDNAVVESFFGTLEREVLSDMQNNSSDSVSREVLDFIDNYYNLVRLHSSLGFTAPVEHEMKQTG